MKKNKGVKELVLLGVLVFIVSFLLNSARWFLNTWDKIDFATVVYQLSTPLQGTNSEVIYDFIIKVLSSTVLMVVIGICAYLFVKTFFERICIEISIKICRFNYLIELGNNAIVKAKITFWFIFVIYAVGAMGSKVKELGIDTYVKSLFDKSTIFEEYYVSPENVEIEFPEQKRNLICIYLESMETTYASKELGGGKNNNYIPELVNLANENVNISNTLLFGGGYSCALTDWTMAAILATTSGVPYKIPGDKNAGGRYSEMLPGIVSFGDILLENGYKNYFMCGSDIEFGGRDIYLKSHGDYKLLDYYYALENGKVEGYTFWGYDDEKLYELAKEELESIANKGELFNYTMLTVDTHQPSGYICELCEEKYDEQYANAIACSSKQAYNFIKWIQEQDWYENTTIIVLGDHNSMVADFWDDIGEYDRRIYNCFINLPENVNKRNIKNREFTTLDIFPTMIAALGAKIEGEQLGLGVNLFSEKKTLMERLGQDVLDSEIFKYSDYYNEYFVK